ncbi:restriction endonuclease [Clostridium saudiense]|uniref:Restriction endonuclease n=1 Tax=Clostridium saudiense TaxID=1414720 RepID=A0ABS2FJP9_9CLOT|nr:restriction endonuclease [Clostridium saudiense]MBM6820211.1 restriction endonuclease [Clostridium saudiense]
MNSIKYLPLIILLFFTLKFLISYIEKSTIDLNKKETEKQIKLGLLSIKDLQKNNYTTFIKIINVYLNILGFKENILLSNGDSNLTNFKASLNNEDVFISCIQNNLLGKTPDDEDNWELTGRPAVQSFLGRLLINNCKKGILITNSSFSNQAIKFANDFNNQNRGIEIKLIDGYELTKSIRNHNYYITKEGLMNEVKYNI